MMEKLPEDWLYVSLSRIESRMDEHGREMRKGFQDIREAQKDHEIDDEQWKGRVKALEDQQDDRSTFGRSVHTSIIAAVFIAVWEGVKHVLGWMK